MQTSTSCIRAGVRGTLHTTTKLMNRVCNITARRVACKHETSDSPCFPLCMFSADSYFNVDSSTAGPGRHHGRPGKWENRGLLGSSLDRVLDNDASLMLTTVWKRGKPAKIMAVRAQENRACGAKKRRASRATRGLKRRPCGRPHTPVGESSWGPALKNRWRRWQLSMARGVKRFVIRSTARPHMASSSMVGLASWRPYGRGDASRLALLSPSRVK